MFFHVYTVVAKFLNCQQKLQVYFMLQTFKLDLATYMSFLHSSNNWSWC